MIKGSKTIGFIIALIGLTTMCLSIYYSDRDETLSKDLLAIGSVLNLLNMYFIYKYQSLRTLPNDKNH